jgi:glycosyltransferase involved in cell wall biosynthesis
LTKPRIVHVIHSSAFGGGPNMLAILCLRLSGEFDMEVICDGQGDVPARLEAAGTKVHRLPLTTKWSFTAQIPRLASTIRALKPALVQLHGQFAGSLGQLALQLAARPKSLYTVQWPSYLDDTGPWSRLRNQTAELVSCRLATAIVAVSENDRKTFIKRGLATPDKISVIHNAYSIEIDEMAASSNASDGGVVGFVGRLADQKGVEHLIRAVPHVMALGRPIVGSAVGGIPEAVDDGRTGLLVPPRDPAAIAQALLTLLDHPDLRAEMASAGRARAKHEFSPGVITAQYAGLYRRLLATTSS